MQNPYYSERLLLEYMQTCVYYNPYLGTYLDSDSVSHITYTVLAGT